MGDKFSIYYFYIEIDKLKCRLERRRLNWAVARKHFDSA